MNIIGEKQIRNVLRKICCGVLTVSLLAAGVNVPEAAGNADKAPEVSLDTFIEQFMKMSAQDAAYSVKTTIAGEDVTTLSDSRTHLAGAGEIAEAIDGSCSLDEQTGIITFMRDGMRVSVRTGSRILAACGQLKVMAEEPYAESGETKVPVEDVAEAFGLETEEAFDGTINISDDFQTKRLIVKSSYNVEDESAKSIVAGYCGLTFLQYADRADALAAYERFSQMDGIEYVQPDGIVSVLAEENETENRLDNAAAEDESKTSETSMNVSETYHSWGIEKTGMDSYMQYISGHYSNLPRVIVAVLDTGIDYNHTAFAERILDKGKNFVAAKNGRTTNLTPQDDLGHGTAVSGIVMEGTLSNTMILPVKVMDNTGNGTDSTVYLGMKYAVEQGADVINLSIGGDGTSSVYEQGITEISREGIPVVVAAGNNHKDVKNVTPANVSAAVTVSSTDVDDNFSASFSNYGEYVDISAPGSVVELVALGGGYRTSNGTSFSTPHVSAALALLKTTNFYLQGDDLISLLLGHAKDLGNSGWDSKFGYGRLDLSELKNYYGVEGVLTVDPQGGTYDEGTNIYLNCSNSNAKIYYTLDGSAPTAQNGTLYAVGFPLTSSKTVRAIAYLDGFPYSSEISADYNIIQKPREFDVTNGIIVKYNGKEEHVVIPESFEGQEVSGIGVGAFSDAQYIRSVTIPGTVQSVSDQAFAGCEYLDSVLVSNRVESFGEDVFSKKTVIYSMEGSAAQKYALENGYSFTAAPGILSQPENIVYGSQNHPAELKVEAIGYNLSYQWYATPDGTTQAAVAIDGAVMPEYKPLAKDDGASYYVQVRAEENEITGSSITNMTKFVYCGKTGDVDGDGKVTPKDALLVLRHISRKTILTQAQLEEADVDKDGKVTAADVLLILQYVAEMIPKL